MMGPNIEEHCTKVSQRTNQANFVSWDGRVMIDHCLIC